jgi:hypothetical protein
MAKHLDRAPSFVRRIESGERQLNVLEFSENVDALGADAAEIARGVVKARG